VVVAQVENESGNVKLPAAMLRSAFHQGLVKRRYSPLALEYVDRKSGDEEYRRGSLQEEAVLEIRVERWDTRLWEANSALLVKLDAHLIDAKDPSGGELWSGRIDRRFDFGLERNQFPTQEALLRHVCTQIATEMLAALPARHARPGYLPEQ
jgi:hypothetical protein